jgi:hypothetical protein
MRPLNDLLQPILSKKVKQYGSKLAHSMTEGNLNKTEKNQEQNYHSMKAYKP